MWEKQRKVPHVPKKVSPKKEVLNMKLHSKNQRFPLLAIPYKTCLLYTSPSPRDRQKSRMPSSA